MRNKNARGRKSGWVLTCRRVCRARAATQGEEEGKKNKLVDVSATFRLGIVVKGGKSEPRLTRDASSLKAQLKDFNSG